MSRNASRKNYRKKSKSQLLKKFTEYLTQEKTRKGLMGRATLNIEKDKYRHHSSFVVTSPRYDWYLQTNNGKIVRIKKIINQNFGKTTSLCFLQFHSLTGCDTVGHFSVISKTCFPAIAEGYICCTSHLKAWRITSIILAALFRT